VIQLGERGIYGLPMRMNAGWAAHGGSNWRAIAPFRPFLQDLRVVQTLPQSLLEQNLMNRADISEGSAMSRRSFLHTTTTAVGAVGVVAAAWPLIDQMNPGAQVRAAGDIIELNLVDLLPAQQRVVYWHNVPVFVVRRTADMLEAMQEKTFVGRLIDPQSEKRQQPPYARNWHRSIDPAYAVLVGVCTACGCVLRYFAAASFTDLAGGYVCPCCASHYDPAGRAHAGIAQYNLPVPPYDIVKRLRIRIGKKASGEIFTLESIERI
jgi:ubiquinol-cytochrome c reductase iron-sulfur subunit